jgi:hypothetical protein
VKSTKDHHFIISLIVSCFQTRHYSHIYIYIYILKDNNYIREIMIGDEKYLVLIKQSLMSTCIDTNLSVSI